MSKMKGLMKQGAEVPAANKLNRYGLYDMEDLRPKQDDMQQDYERILKPMASYAPFLTEDEAYEIFNRRIVDDDSYLFVEEELTYEDNKVTINEEIDAEPRNLDAFLSYIRNRLKKKPAKYLTEKEQSEFVDVVLEEARCKYKELKREIEDPILNEEENIELRRRLFVNSISICEKLFNHYILYAEILRKRNVFTDSANFTRIKTRLSNDCATFFNVHSLRLHLATEMKKHKFSEPEISYSDRTPHEKLIKNLVLKDLVDDFRLKYQHRVKRFKTDSDNLKELFDSMPVLQTKKLEKMLSYELKKHKELMEERRLADQELIRAELEKKAKETKEEKKRARKAAEPPSDMVLIRRLAEMPSDFQAPPKKGRSRSMHKFSELTLAEELNIDIASVTADRFKTTDFVKLRFVSTGLRVDAKNEDSPASINLLQLSKQSDITIANKLKKDLENLTWMLNNPKMSQPSEDSELLMTLTSKPDHKKRMKEIKRKIKMIDERHKKFLEEIKLPVVPEKETHVQPATVEKYFKNDLPVRLSDIRVSTRMLRFNVTLNTFGPLYNDISREIDLDMVRTLDRNLFIGGEVKEVYDELLKTLSHNHLRFDLDDYVQKAPTKLPNYDSSYTSVILNKIGRTKAINPDLLTGSKKIQPWLDQDYREWNRTPINQPKKTERLKNGKIKQTVLVKPIELSLEKLEMFKNADPATLTNKELRGWLNWWNDHFSTEDYFKFLSLQNTDYLSLIFHLYTEKNDLSAIQTEEEKILANAKLDAEKQRQSMIEELNRTKNSFQNGFWNPNAVLLGGLGNDPVPDEAEDPVIKLEKSIQQSRPKNRKIQFFKFDENAQQEEEEARERILALMQQKKTEPPQVRLERVWFLLRMSDAAKLDMAIKYSTTAYLNQLLPAIEEWEKATKMIVEREKYIYELENFERTASDPNRFFVKGYRGSSGARLSEALQRERLYQKIDEIQSDLEKLLVSIEQTFHDKVTYNGRLYVEKMKWDRVEMLYWLSEERRMKFFKHELSLTSTGANGGTSPRKTRPKLSRLSNLNENSTFSFNN